jgi:hypothetical protein
MKANHNIMSAGAVSGTRYELLLIVSVASKEMCLVVNLIPVLSGAQDICDIVSRAGLVVENIYRFHFGTTYVIVAKPGDA